MTPAEFPQFNAIYGPPPNLEESQCRSIHAYHGTVEGGSVDGSRIVVTCWHPTDEELALIAAGQPIFVSMIGGLAPHYLSANFENAIRPA